MSDTKQYDEDLLRILEKKLSPMLVGNSHIQLKGKWRIAPFFKVIKGGLKMVFKHFSLPRGYGSAECDVKDVVADSDNDGYVIDQEADAECEEDNNRDYIYSQC